MMKNILLILLCCTSVLAQSEKFQAAAGERALGRYVVTIEDDSGTVDIAQRARELAGAYGGRLELFAGGGATFAVSMLPVRAKALSADPRVRSVVEVIAGVLAPSVPLAATPGAVVTPSVPKHVRSNSYDATWNSGQYVYDGAGNIVSIGSNTYLYDGVSRLVRGTARTAAYDNMQCFTYDAFGNMKQIVSATQIVPRCADITSITGATTVAGVNPANNRIEVVSPPGAPANAKIEYGTFDDAGNQTSSDAITQYSYDSMHRIAELTTPAQQRDETYLYDGSDDRIATLTFSGAGQLTGIDRTLRDMDGKVLREVSQFPSGGNWTWQWLKDYVYRDSSLLAAVAAGPNNTTVTTHFHLDHLGTPRLITSDTGARLAQHTYLPFGGEAPGSDHDYEKMKFTGAERDAGATGDGTSLDYMHARFYSSSMARFLSVDPALDIERLLKTPHAWNPFVYASNNPLSRRDPDGRRDLYFAIWASRFPFFGNGSVGHVTVLEMDGRTVSSPFPTPHGWRGQYTNLSYIDTINQKEHRMPDFLYKVHVPNDAKFDAVIAEKTKADTWIALPLSRHSTNCVDTPTDALNAGGVPVSSPTNPILTPEGLAFALDSLESQQNPPVYGSGPFPPARVRGEDDWSVEQIHPHLDDTPPE